MGPKSKISLFNPNFGKKWPLSPRINPKIANGVTWTAQNPPKPSTNELNQKMN